MYRSQFDLSFLFQNSGQPIYAFPLYFSYNFLSSYLCVMKTNNGFLMYYLLNN